MTAPAAFASTPDYDSIRTVAVRSLRTPTTYRLRIWREARLVVATETAANEGMSITNAIEAVAHDAEVVLRAERFVDPRSSLPFNENWSLCEHYDRGRQADTGTFDHVEFASHRVGGDELQLPKWSPWRESEVVR